MHRSVSVETCEFSFTVVVHQLMQWPYNVRISEISASKARHADMGDKTNAWQSESTHIKMYVYHLHTIKSTTCQYRSVHTHTYHIYTRHLAFFCFQVNKLLIKVALIHWLPTWYLTTYTLLSQKVNRSPRHPTLHMHSNFMYKYAWANVTNIQKKKKIIFPEWCGISLAFKQYNPLIKLSNIYYSGDKFYLKILTH